MTVQQPSQTLMFGYDYQPSRTLQHVSRLQQSVTRTILGQQIGDDGQAVVSDTSEWTTHLAYYQTQGDVPGEYVLLFTRSGQVSQGDQLSLGSSATFFSDEINMLEVTLGGGGGGDGATPEDETPTPEEGTPEDGTPTPEEGTPTPEEGTPTPEEGTPTPEEGTPTPEEPGGGNGGGDGGDGGGGGGGGGGNGGGG